MKDDEFYEKVKNILIYKNLEGKYKALNEYFGAEISDAEAEKGTQAQAIYYVSDEIQQAQYVSMFKDAGLDAILCDTYIDPHFISYIEYKNPKQCRFVRIDADIDGALKAGEAEETDNNALLETFKKHLINQEITIKAERFKSGKIPAIINVEEFMRRMNEMNGFLSRDVVERLQHETDRRFAELKKRAEK